MLGKSARPSILNTLLLTVVAMLAFAANSLLCRLALGQGLIDAASFTSVRVISGAVVLALIMLPRRHGRDRSPVDWRSVAMLFTYMALFSFAYLSLAAGTGALILFGAVQLTMFIAALPRMFLSKRVSRFGSTLCFLSTGCGGKTSCPAIAMA